MRFSFIDLFSGVGGFRVALEKIGGKCIGFSEIDKNAIEVYRDNFNSKEEIYLGDITKIEKLPKADIFVGGVPCQLCQLQVVKKGLMIW
jgi:DNA (cytosine-5)-methyltransferase 1